MIIIKHHPTLFFMGMSLGDCIADQVLQAFRSQPGKGKPLTRSNGLKEWTIVAAVVAVFGHKQDQKIEVLSLATGLKALPDVNIQVNQAKGYLVHDSHAEILAIRMFNYRLILELLHLTAQPTHDNSKFIRLIEPSSSGLLRPWKIRDDVKLGLYVSELPCGDCSMAATQQNEGKTLVEKWEQPIKRIKLDLLMEQGAIRGRSHFTELGSVRTKPGRPDSLITLSKSCSDKLTIKQYTGLLNAVTSVFIEPQNTYLQWLVLPEDKLKESNLIDIRRCFKSRFSFNEPSSMTSYKLKHFEVLSTRKKFEFAKTGVDQAPCMNAIVSIPKGPHITRDVSGAIKFPLHEVINSGVKLGCNSKKEKTCIKPKSSLILSRRRIVESSLALFTNVLSDSNIQLSCFTQSENVLDYCKMKKANSDRETAKRFARDHLKGWIPTSSDNFYCELQTP